MTSFYQGNNLITTPILYAAKGSHGTYSSPGSIKYNHGGPFKLFDEMERGIIMWRGRDELVPFVRK